MIRHGIIGAVMAVVMLWMLHEPIMSGGISLSWGFAAFVLAHVAVVVMGAGLALFVPRVRHLLSHHRPNLRHMGAMLAGAIVLAGSIHIYMHGVA